MPTRARLRAPPLDLFSSFLHDRDYTSFFRVQDRRDASIIAQFYQKRYLDLLHPSHPFYVFHTKQVDLTTKNASLFKRFCYYVDIVAENAREFVLFTDTKNYFLSIADSPLAWWWYSMNTTSFNWTYSLDLLFTASENLKKQIVPSQARYLLLEETLLVPPSYSSSFERFAAHAESTLL